MTKKELIFRNPFGALGIDCDDMINGGELGAVMARAGLGKTSMVVQMALHAMACGKNVLHVSLDEPVVKVNVWYNEMFTNLADLNRVEEPQSAYDEILPNRMILTMNVDGFSVARLEERITDLIEQGLFKPDMMIIDGYPFEEKSRADMEELKALAARTGSFALLTVKTHRHEAPADNGLPVQLTGVDDIFSTLLQIIPENNTIFVKAVKGAKADKDAAVLDPETMIIR
ncbi:AAA family ATPase [Desulfoluna sp.]|uniref:AAA family ATPase n=1 Tax=Desulfoluna sp. TaxID=2045199 RepID=UPI002606AA31|nr:AAA family ATPase [Desulfoluna sp.]